MQVQACTTGWGGQCNGGEWDAIKVGGSGAFSDAKSFQPPLPPLTSTSVGSLQPNTAYAVRSRASNALGAGPWSAVQTCYTAGPPGARFPYEMVGAVLGGSILLLVIGIFLCWKCNLTKVLAPLLRKRDSTVRVSQFMSSDNVAMEDADPELTINPVLSAQLQRQREAQRKKKVHMLGAGLTGRSGALKRLGIILERKQPAKPDPAARARKERKDLDAFLGLEDGRAAGGGAAAQGGAAAEQGGTSGACAQQKMLKRVAILRQQDEASSQNLVTNQAQASQARSNAAARSTAKIAGHATDFSAVL